MGTSFINLPYTIQNKVQELESNFIKPYIKKSHFFDNSANGICVKAAISLHKALMVANSGTT
jgi:hypothetical protein